MDQTPAHDATVAKKRKCEGADCSNDAGTLQCPTCQKLGKESYFCGQDCFKRNWVGLLRKIEQRIYKLAIAVKSAYGRT